MKKTQFWADLKSGEFASMVKESSKGKCLLASKEVYNVMKPVFAEKDDTERIYCIFLNGQNKVIAIEKMFEGTISHTVIYPREQIGRFFSLVILTNAVTVTTCPSERYLTLPFFLDTQ